MNSSEQLKEILQTIPLEDLVQELHRRDFKAEQIEQLRALAQEKESKLKTRSTTSNQTEIQSISGESANQLDQEAKKWAEIIKTKGVGLVIARTKKGWLVDGKPVEKTFKIPGSDPGGMIELGVFGKEQFRLSDSWYYENAYRKVPGRGYETTFVAIEPQTDSMETPVLHRMYEFNFIMPQANYDIDSRGGTFRFIFALPTNQGRQFLESVKSNPDLIESTFQNVYPGLTGEDQVQRKASQQAHFVDVSSWSRQPKPTWYVGPLPPLEPQIKIGTLHFSRPIGEFKG